MCRNSTLLEWRNRDDKIEGIYSVFAWGWREIYSPWKKHRL